MEGGGDDVGLAGDGRGETHLGVRGEGVPDVGEGRRGDSEPEHGDDVVAQALVVELHVQVEDSGGTQAVQAPSDRGFRQVGARLQFGER